MTGTKVKSAASLLMQSMETAALSAQSLQDYSGNQEADFSRVIQNTRKDTLQDLPVSGSAVSGSVMQAHTPIRVDKSSLGTVKGASGGVQQVSAKDSKSSADSGSQKGYRVEDVVESAIRDQAVSDASQNVAGSIDTVTREDGLAETGAGAVADGEIQSIDPEVMEVLSTATGQLIDFVADILGISPEELIEAIGSLSLNSGDLFDTESLKALIVQIAGEGDPLSVAMDEQLFKALEDVAEGARDAADALREAIGELTGESLSEGELRDLLKAYDAGLQAQAQVEDADASDNGIATVSVEKASELEIVQGVRVQDEISTGNAFQGIVAQGTDTQKTVNTETQNADIQLPVRDGEGVVTEVVIRPETEDPDHIMEDSIQGVSLTDSRTQHSEDKPHTAERAAEVTGRDEQVQMYSEKPVEEPAPEPLKEAVPLPERETGSDADAKGGSGRSSGDTGKDSGISTDDSTSRAERGSEGAAIVRDFVDFARSEMSAPVKEAPVPTPQIDPYELIRQISQNMKAEVSREVTEIHMQLNPETLGNLHIHVTSKAGTITAQFIAENEAVKNALQTQTVELRENLQEQGLKVEAVEVTIAGQELNRSYQQNGEGQGRFEEAKPKKSKISRIRMTGTETAEDIDAMGLDEGDRLTAEMMAINGGSINYLA